MIWGWKLSNTDKRKHHGTLDKHSSEQQFHKSDAITVPMLCEKTGAVELVQPGLMAAGR